MFVPDDIRLRTYATEIGRERTHVLRRVERGDEVDLTRDDPWLHREREERRIEVIEQDSLFAAISAVALDEEHTTVAVATADHDDASLVLELGSVPMPVAAADGAPVAAEVPRHQRRKVLRARNTDAAKDLVARTGLPHARVNAELNKRAGITRITDATLAQLEARLKAAQEWRASLKPATRAPTPRG
jgi:alkaline phosphatase